MYWFFHLTYLIFLFLFDLTTIVLIKKVFSVTDAKIFKKTHCLSSNLVNVVVEYYQNRKVYVNLLVTFQFLNFAYFSFISYCNFTYCNFIIIRPLSLVCKGQYVWNISWPFSCKYWIYLMTNNSIIKNQLNTSSLIKAINGPLIKAIYFSHILNKPN